jgi:hypothetical protein
MNEAAKTMERLIKLIPANNLLHRKNLIADLR